MRGRGVLGLALALAALWSPAASGQRSDVGFTTALSERAAAQYAMRFGPQALERLEDWKWLADMLKSARASERELLAWVNSALNRIRAVPDERHWGRPDYWATPAEVVASGAGDCEDIAIAKYFLLKELGVAIERLRLMYVKSLEGDRPHMLLVYAPKGGEEALLLDNAVDEVLDASRRPDLDPVYHFNEREMWVATRGAAGTPRRLAAWGELLRRLDGETR